MDRWDEYLNWLSDHFLCVNEVPYEKWIEYIDLPNNDQIDIIDFCNKDND